MYPGTHNLDWRGWTSDEREGWTWGQWEGSDRWNAGNPPLFPPRPVQVGSSACIESGGGGYEVNTDAAGLERWLPAACYGDVSFGDIINMCPALWQFAWVMEKVYDNPVLAEGRARTMLGPDIVVNRFSVPIGDRYSASLVARRGRIAYQWIDGTRNSGQLLSQIYNGTVGVRDYGRFTASEIYNDYATRVLMRFDASDCDQCNKWVLIGHSYGGATAAVAAARLRISRPNDDIALFTIGAPRAGGGSLINVLRGVSQTHIRRAGDPVPWLPPTLTSGWPQALEAIVAPGWWDRWSVFRDYERRRLLKDQKWVPETEDRGPPDDVWNVVLGLIWQGLPLNNFDSHAITNYWQDLQATCTAPTNTLEGTLNFAISPSVRDCCG